MVIRRETEEYNGGQNSASSFFCVLLKEMWICFSNSLIIHKENTKKITTETAVWISDTNYHKILQTLSLNFSNNYCSFEKLQ